MLEKASETQALFEDMRVKYRHVSVFAQITHTSFQLGSYRISPTLM